MVKIICFILIINLTFSDCSCEPKSFRQKAIQDSKLLTSSLGVFTAYRVKTVLASVGLQKKPNNRKLVQSDMASFLGRRVFSYDSENYSPGLMFPDIYYPDYFTGVWNVSSKLIDVEAPLDVDVFGGKLVYDAVKKDINSTIYYKSKFKLSNNGNSNLYLL